MAEASLRSCLCESRVFSRDLAKLGYDLPKNEPGLRSVITFDERRQGIVLTTGAREPVEYVEPIKAWLSSHEKIGRCIPASCIACGREFHVFSADVPEVRERWCRACAADLNWFERLLVKSEAAALVVLVLLELLILGGCLPKEGWLHDYVPWISGPAVLIQIWVWVQVGESNLCRIGRRIISKYLTLAAAGDVIATFIETPPNKNLDHTFRSQ